MAINDYSTTPASNITISSINIDEGCAPSNINGAIRQMMADIKTGFSAATQTAEFVGLGVGAVRDTAHTTDITATASDKVGLRVRGASSQTANLQNWSSNAGTLLAFVNSSGYVGTARITNTSGTSIAYLSPTGADFAVYQTADGHAANGLRIRNSTGASSANFASGGDNNFYMTVNTNNGFSLGVNGTAGNVAALNAANWLPGADNTIDVGNGSFRIKQYYGVSTSISTSDERDKQDMRPLTTAEVRALKQVAGQLLMFRWRDAVAAKGDAARWHCGPMAQAYRDAFLSEGLDPTVRAAWCADPIVERVSETDEAGAVRTVERPVIDPETGEQRVRYGLRHDLVQYEILAAMMHPDWATA